MALHGHFLCYLQPSTNPMAWGSEPDGSIHVLTLVSAIADSGSLSGVFGR
jgi:hypothetical protein